MANKIQIRRGKKANLPFLDVGEPALCIDTKEVFVGNTGGNVELVNRETLNDHLGNYILQIPYAAAEGSANDYTVTLKPAMASYAEGVAVAVKINVSNTGASTININGLGAKAIVDAKGKALTSGKLTAGGIYTLRYNGTNFILQGEGGEYGTATAEKVLTGYSIGTDRGLVNGSMADNGPVSTQTINLTSNSQEYIIAQGYHSGLRKIKAVITNLVAGVIKAGATVGDIAGTFTADATATAAQILSGATAYINGSKITGTIPIRSSEYRADNYALWNTGTEQRVYVKPPQGYYSGQAGGGTWTGGNSCYVVENNLAVSNIRAGVSILGMNGTLDAKKIASGTTTGTKRDAGGFYVIDLTINTLSFRPRTLVLWGYYSYTMGVYTYTEEISPLVQNQNSVCYRSNSGSNVTGNIYAAVVATTIYDNGFTVNGLDYYGFNDSIRWLAIG